MICCFNPRQQIERAWYGSKNGREADRLERMNHALAVSVVGKNAQFQLPIIAHNQLFARGGAECSPNLVSRCHERMTIVRWARNMKFRPRETFAIENELNNQTILCKRATNCFLAYFVNIFFQGRLVLQVWRTSRQSSLSCGKQR